MLSPARPSELPEGEAQPKTLFSRILVMRARLFLRLDYFLFVDKPGGCSLRRLVK
jgi:hypothetical protein